MSTAYPKCRSLRDRQKNDPLSRTSSSKSPIRFVNTKKLAEQDRGIAHVQSCSTESDRSERVKILLTLLSPMHVLRASDEQIGSYLNLTMALSFLLICLRKHMLTKWPLYRRNDNCQRSEWPSCAVNVNRAQ